MQIYALTIYLVHIIQNRKRFMYMDTYLKPQIIDYGFPKGSALGPFLYSTQMIF